MKTKISFADPVHPTQGTLVLLVDDVKALDGRVAEVDTALGGALSRAIKASDFKGEARQVLEIAAPSGGTKADAASYDWVFLVGLGDAGALDVQGLEALGGTIAGALGARKVREASVLVGDRLRGAFDAADQAVALATGARLRLYSFALYSKKRQEAEKDALRKLNFLCEKPSQARRQFGNAEKAVEAVFLTRDLVSEPANILHPESFAKRIDDVLTPLGISVEILGEKQMRKLGMGSLLGVGQGSARESQLVVMRYAGASGKGKGSSKKGKETGKNGLEAGALKNPVALVGKGVTFDTGGISIKPAGGMEDMKWDMGGAAVVVGAMAALAGRKARADVVGLVGLVENMPSGTAQRPGDVVTSASGKTIEVLNTDAEGRLVLADALWYAQEKEGARTLVDLATLTGAIIVALGHEYAGLFANDDALADRLVAAGKAVGDPLWRLPLGEAYDKELDSPIADMKNIGGRAAGSITAAQFLQRFVNEGHRWAHLDIAGVTWATKDKPTVPKGGTGFGVRLLDRFIAMEIEG